MACCPFHNEKTPSFTVSETKQFYYCFGCHAKGNVIGFLMDYDHLSYIDAIETLAAEAHMDVPREESDRASANRDDKQPLYDALKQASVLYQQQLKVSERAVNYLKQRGLSGEVARLFKIGYAPDEWNFLTGKTGHSEQDMAALIKTGLVIKKENKSYDRFRDRIMFPITDQRGRVIGFGGRILDKGEPKYLNSPENPVFHKGYELYGLYECKQALRDIERIIIVEGYMDVVALTQHGINYAVASLGTATTTEQIQKTFHSTHEIVFCYDGDIAGKKAAWRALENTLPVIRDGKVAKFLFLPEKEDPDTMVRKEGSEAFETRIKNARTLSDFLFERLKSDSDISTHEGKAQLASKANALIQKMHNSLYKDLLIEELSQLVGLSHQHLESKISADTKQEKTVPVKAKPARGLPVSQQVANNITRLAVALLIQNPDLAINCQVPESFMRSSNKGLRLLYLLQQTITSFPGISSAALLERFRDTEHDNTVQTLAILQTQETENRANILTEYTNIIGRLSVDDRYNFLTQKCERGEQLTNDELKEFLTIRSEKH